MSNQYKIEIKSLPKSELEIKGQIEPLLLEEARKKALKSFSEKLDLPGFRKGHIPENIIIQRISEREILEEAANILLNDFYPKIVTENKINSIGRPKVTITKLALGNPLEFTITTAIIPEFELGDYREISKKAQKNIGKVEDEKIEVSEKEIEDVILQIRKNKAHFDWHKANPKAEGHNHPDLDKEENLPVLDDNFAKSAGNFENVSKFREKVRDNIISEKKLRNVEKKRAAIIDALLKDTEISLPEIVIESEIDKSLAQMKDDIQRVGAKYEDYLKETKKTEEEIRKNLAEGAERKAKIQLIFNKIAEIEKMEANKEILGHEVKQILEHYPGASEENARIYVSTQLINQEVLKLLEDTF